MELASDKEFKSLITRLSTDEFARLEQNIIEEGCRDALVVWQPAGADVPTILDGHNRYEICQERDIEFEIVYSLVSTRHEAKVWVINNQLGRRNLTREQMAYLRGKRYEQEKQEHGGDRKSKKVEQVEEGATCSKTAEELASEYKVSEKTIRNNAQFARAVDSVAEMGDEDTKDEILQRDTRMTQKDIRELAAMKKRDEKRAKDILGRILQGRSASQQTRVTIFSHESVEYYTPLEYIDAARQVMGDIDLDPASCEAAQEWIKAKSFYIKEGDGLLKAWGGRVWLNPPYSKTGARSNQDIWSEKLITEYKNGNVAEAILLVKAALGYKWFENLWYAWPACFARSRISFIKNDGTNDGQSKQGTAFLYLGPNKEKFREVFGRIGRVIFPEEGYYHGSE